MLCGLTTSFQAKCEEAVILKDVTIVVTSCDRYQEFWDPFLFSFLKPGLLYAVSRSSHLR